MTWGATETSERWTEAQDKSNEIFHRTLQVWFSAWTIISTVTAVACGVSIPGTRWYFALMIVTGGMVVGLVGGIGLGSALSIRHLDRIREKPEGTG